jgi:hypothetical protein
LDLYQVYSAAQRAHGLVPFGIVPAETITSRCRSR